MAIATSTPPSLQGHQNRKSCQSVEYFTPEYIVKAARETLGSIDLDPASCPAANKVVQARVYYSLEDGGDGLLMPWNYNGRSDDAPTKVFLNYPSWAKKWWMKLLEERSHGYISSAIVVAYSADPVFSTQAGCGLSMADFPVCLLRQRVAYLVEQPDGSLQPKRGTPCHSAIVYVPGTDDYTERFYDAFRQYGTIVTPYR